MPARPPSDFPVEALIDPAKTVADAMRRGDWTNPLLAYDLYEDLSKRLPPNAFDQLCAENGVVFTKRHELRVV